MNMDGHRLKISLTCLLFLFLNCIASATTNNNRLGNKAFAAKDYDEAIKHYTAAIAIDSKNCVYYSNRRWDHSWLLFLFTVKKIKSNTHPTQSQRLSWRQTKLGPCRHRRQRMHQNWPHLSQGLLPPRQCPIRTKSIRCGPLHHQTGISDWTGQCPTSKTTTID